MGIQQVDITADWGRFTVVIDGKINPACFPPSVIEELRAIVQLVTPDPDPLPPVDIKKSTKLMKMGGSYALILPREWISFYCEPAAEDDRTYVVIRETATRAIEVVPRNPSPHWTGEKPREETSDESGG